jgi:hypothetical protein
MIKIVLFEQLQHFNGKALPNNRLSGFGNGNGYGHVDKYINLYNNGYGNSCVNMYGNGYGDGDINGDGKGNGNNLSVSFI